VTARNKGGGGELTMQGRLTHRRVTRPVARAAQLLCAEQMLAEGGYVKEKLRELLEELGILTDTRGVKPERGQPGGRRAG